MSRFVFARLLWVLPLGMGLVASSVQARPPLMPSFAEDTQTSGSGEQVPRVQPHVEPAAQPTRLGIQGGVVAPTQPGNVGSIGEIFVGGRLFSRIPLGGRWYLIPAVGYYRLASYAAAGSAGPNLVELNASLQFALFRLGPIGVLVGATQRVDYRFSWDSTGLRGLATYRLGPGANVNLRLTPSTSVLLGMDLTFPFNSSLRPEWTSHVGFLFSL